MKLTLLQYNAAFSGQSYLPLSVASLWSYYKKFGQTDVVLHEVVYRRDNPESVARRIKGSDVIAASLYVWNEQLTLKTLHEVKKANPSSWVIVGGPQVPDNAEEWLRTNAFVDVAVHGEGEQVFTQLLDALNTVTAERSDLSAIPGLSYRDLDGAILQTPASARMRELDIPSPFLDGTFDDLLRRNPQEQWMALWETNRGCPFTCTFCDWGSATNAKVSRFPLERLKAEVLWMAQNKIEFIFACDANFGLLPRDIEIADYLAEVAAEHGYPKRISTQGAKNVTERSLRVQKILHNAGIANGATLSMQSISPTVLEAIKRDNISLESYFDLQRRYQDYGIPTYVDLILGLPNETLASYQHGVCTLIEYGQHDHMQFNNLSLLPNAAMSHADDRKNYGLTVIRTPVLTVHGDPNEHRDQVLEYQELVVGTNTMPANDWVEARAFSWLVSLVHLDKIGQPLTLLTRSITDASYEQIFQRIMEARSAPVLNLVVNAFRRMAEVTQSTGQEYFYDDRYMNVSWAGDEFMFARLVHEDLLKRFIEDVRVTLGALIDEKAPHSPDGALINAALDDAADISFGQLILPGITSDLTLDLQTNALDLCAMMKSRQRSVLVADPRKLFIDRTGDERFVGLTFEEWCRQVVWYRNKRGAYDYGVGSKQVLTPVGHYR